MNRIIATRARMTLPNPEDVKLVLPGSGKGVKKVRIEVREGKRRALYDNQPTPIHDFLNFKDMTGNEILLNMENHEHFVITELLGSLHELGQRKTPNKVDWMTHPIVVSAMKHLKEKIYGLTAKQLAQVPIILDKLKWTDKQMWQSTSENILRLLHKYRGRDMAYFLDLFDRDFLDEEGEPYMKFQRTDDVFFERIVALLPMYLPHFNKPQLIRTFAILTKRGLGSERLFNNYIYLQIERQMLSFTGSQYCKILRILSDKGYQEDKVFW